MANRSAEEVLEILQAHKDDLRRFGVDRLGLFGSVARGKGESNSDLDFVVTLKKKSFDSFMDLRAFLQDLFGCPIDLVLSDAIKPRLREAILNQTLYAAGL